MTTGVTFDLRDEDFRSHAEMDRAVEAKIARCQAEFDAFVLMAIVLHERQVKWLKLELYERGIYTAGELRKLHLGDWQGVPIVTTDAWEGGLCENCGRLHDDE